MAKTIVWIKKEIKTEADLPVKGEYYLFHGINESLLRILCYCPKTDDMELLPKYYVDKYDYYLQPIELDLPDVNLIKKLANEYADTYFADIDTVEKQMKHDACIVDFICKAQWLRDKIKNQLE